MAQSINRVPFDLQDPLGLNPSVDQKQKEDRWFITDSEGGTHVYPTGYTLRIQDRYIEVSDEFEKVQAVFYLPRAAIKRSR